VIYSESEIDLRRSSGKIKKTFLVPHSGKMEINPATKEAIENADFIFIGPGDLFTSITPNFLVLGVKESFAKTRAKIVYILNIMTKYGETDDFKASNFMEKIEKYLGRRIDIVLANNKRPDEDVLKKYEAENANLVELDIVKDKFRKIIADDIITEGELARHDAEKLRNAILKIIRNNL
ncbi:YvcK family protein, partial [Patescibacteria group bacterium]|nr:YvcK family protein [Patescibacteria group bacterium]